MMVELRTRGFLEGDQETCRARRQRHRRRRRQEPAMACASEAQLHFRAVAAAVGEISLSAGPDDL